MTRIMPPSYPLRQHRASMGSLPESRFPGQCDSLPRSSDKSAAFCFAFPLLIDRIAVSHDARPGLHMHDAIFQHGSAQNDAAIHVPIRRKIADAARIRPSRSSEEHTPELQSLLRSAYAVFCLKKKKNKNTTTKNPITNNPR